MISEWLNRGRVIEIYVHVKSGFLLVNSLNLVRIGMLCTQKCLQGFHGGSWCMFVCDHYNQMHYRDVVYRISTCIILWKYLFEYIKSLRCYELTRRYSLLYTNFTIDLCCVPFMHQCKFTRHRPKAIEFYNIHFRDTYELKNCLKYPVLKNY